jgi:hypothetical protein
MKRTLVLACLVALLIAWSMADAFVKAQASKPDPCGQYFEEDAVQ